MSTEAPPQPPRGRVFIHTFGCQMNDVDSRKMSALLKRDGYEPTSDPDAADLILLNTCSVREKAVDKMHSALGEYRKLKRDGKEVALGLVGCVAQERGAELFERYRDVDLVFGPDGVPHVRDHMARVRAGERVLDTEFRELDAYPFVSEADLSPWGVCAFVTIQKGCDNKCTFCIVPSTRGAEVSRPHEQVLDEVRAVVARGARDITLIGQNVNSYGLKAPGELTFAQLLYAVAEIEGVERLRYTTSHPRDMGDDVVQAYRDLPQLASHLHLPVQSGSNKILRRMKRFYTRERLLEVVDALRSARPELVLTTDVIVGFPDETEEDFAQTLELADQVGFVGSFSFKYSPRPGTPALRIRNAVPNTVAADRLQRYQDRQRERSAAWYRDMQGTVQRILVEGPSRHDEGVVCGRTSSFAMLNMPGSLDLVGQLVDVRVTRGFTHSARAEIVPATA